MKRTHNVMLRFTEAELAALKAAAPAGEELAVFARKTLLESLGGAKSNLRHAAAFIVAALSPDIDIAQALTLFDEHVSNETANQ